MQDHPQFKDQFLRVAHRNLSHNPGGTPPTRYSHIPHSHSHQHQTIISLYDKIAQDNANDPLYMQVSSEKAHRTARQARQGASSIREVKNETISKFMGHLSIDQGQDGRNNTRQSQRDGRRQQRQDQHQAHKISLLKRIIEHYNMRSIERKYYTNMIKNYGVKVEEVNSSDIAVKKNLHPREQHLRSINTSLARDRPQRELVHLMDAQAEQQEGPSSQKSRNIIAGISSMHRNMKQLRRSMAQECSLEQLKQKLEISIDPMSTVHMSLHQAPTADKQPGALADSPHPRTRTPAYKIRRSVENSQKLVQKPIKFQPSTSIQDKLNKYKQFLFVVNFSNGVYIDLDVEKYDRTYKYYIGRGNNRNLVRSLMKKRFWFEEVADYREANFVWTQIKIEAIYQRQKVGVKGTEGDAENSEAEVDCNQGSRIFKKVGAAKEQKYGTMGTKTSTSRHKIVRNIKQNKITKNKSNARDYQPHDPYLKIATQEDLQQFRQIAEGLLYKKYPTFADKHKISKKKLEILEHFPPKHPASQDEQQQPQHIAQVHNHLQYNGIIGNKKALYYSLKQYCRLTGKKLSDYVPLTFHIRQGLTDPEYRAMASLFAQRKRNKLPNYWIMKPGEFSNRGQGITCANRLQQIRKRVIKCRELSKQGKEASLIVQNYIANPLLYNGRKFDIRVFMMVTANNGKVKGYWYQEGYVRTSSFLWNIEDVDDKFVHLTNDAIQKNCEEYGLYQPGNKLTFADLQRYIHALAHKHPSNSKGISFFDSIYPRMREVATDIIRCSYLHLDPQRLLHNFQIFGLDFMIDSDYRPWLIEVNTNPCLQLNCPILERILPHLVENAFRLALDPLFPPPSTVNTDYKYSIPENAVCYNKFEMVFDEDRDGRRLRDLYRGSAGLDWMEGVEEDQEEYEAEGELLDFTGNQ